MTLTLQTVSLAQHPPLHSLLSGALSLPVLVKSLFIWAMNPVNHMDSLCTQADSGKDDNVIILGIQVSMPEFQPEISVGVGYAGLRNPLSQSQTIGDREEDSLESLLLPTSG